MIVLREVEFCELKVSRLPGNGRGQPSAEYRREGEQE